MTLFDIVIPLGTHDRDAIENQIKYTKQNIIGHRNIYLVMSRPLLEIEGTISLDESIFPFSVSWIEERNPIIVDPRKEYPRQGGGWYLQQLIKLLCSFYIDDILEDYLVLDADTFFLKKTNFFENSIPLYNIGYEFNKPYFFHMNRLDNNFVKTTKCNISGICHHMVFQKKYIQEIIDITEKKHNKKFHEIFIDSVSQRNSGASEYELYFHYMNKYHRDKIKIRKLKFLNTGDDSLLKKNTSFDYISFHKYLKK